MELDGPQSPLLRLGLGRVVSDICLQAGRDLESHAFQHGFHELRCDILAELGLDDAIRRGCQEGRGYALDFVDRL